MGLGSRDVKVAVLGPGAVGGVLAVGLVRAGVQVVCVARPDTAKVIASSGLTLRHGSQEAETVRPEATTELRESVDLLLVTEAAVDRTRRGHADPVAAGAEIVADRGDEAEPDAQFGDVDISRRSAAARQ